MKIFNVRQVNSLGVLVAVWFLLVCSSFQLQAQIETGRAEYTLNSNGQTRSYLLYVPRGYKGEALPLVFNLHGSGSNPDSHFDYTRLDKVADKEKFLLVYPAGIYANSKTGQTNSWNATADPDGVDDVQFIRDVLTDVSARASVDSARIYATGFSGGARMTSRLACEMADVFVAIAPVGGVQFPDGCMPSGSIAVLAFHGTADQVNPYEVGSDAPAYWSMGVETALSRWREVNACPATGQVIDVSDKVSLHYFPRCSNKVNVDFFRIIDGGHTWPGAAKSANPILGSTTMDINASELIWSFFNQFNRKD